MSTKKLKPSGSRKKKAVEEDQPMEITQEDTPTKSVTITPPTTDSTKKSKKPSLNRQATPFAVTKSSKSSTKKSSQQPLPALNEDEEDEEKSDADDHELMKDAASDSDDGANDEDAVSDPTGSLAAQFEAASGASDGDESESSEDDADDQDQEPAKKKRKTGTDSTTSKGASSSSTPTTPKQLTITPTTEKELQYHLKQLHRIMKKLRAFQTKKVVRKLKDTKALNPPESVLTQLESDLELSKNFNLDHMSVYAWRIYNLQQSGKKLNWSNAEQPTLETIGLPPSDATTSSSSTPSPRLKELLSQTLHSPASKKAITDYFTLWHKKQRKDKKYEKKLETIVETAAKRKEKEKAIKKKLEEREKQQKEAKEKKADAKDSDDMETEESEKPTAEKPSTTAAETSDTDEARDAKRAEKVSRREQQKLKKTEKDAAEKESKKKEVAAAEKAKEKKTSDSESESDSDSDDEDGPSKPKSLKSKPSRVFSGLSVGHIVEGIISGVEKFGLFIEFVYKKKERKGLCHISMASDSYIPDLNASFAKGDAVQAIVTKLDEKTGRISLGLKASLFPADKKPKPIQHLSQTAKALESKKEKEFKDANGAPKMESVFIDTLAEKKEPDAKLATIKRFMIEVKGTGNQKSEKKNRLGQRERRKLIGAVLGEEAIKPVLEDKRAGWKRKMAENQHERSETTNGSSSTPKSSATTPSLPSFLTDGTNGPVLNRQQKRLKLHAEQMARGEAPKEWVAAYEAGKFSFDGPKPKKVKTSHETNSTTTPTTSTTTTQLTKSHAAPTTHKSTSKPTSNSAHRPSSSATAASKPTKSTPASTAAPDVLDETMHPSWLAKQAQAAKIAAAPKGKKITFD